LDMDRFVTDLVGISFLLGTPVIACAIFVYARSLPSSSQYKHWTLVRFFNASS